MYYPNLELPVEEEPHYGKYGRMRMNYIKEHRPGLYTELFVRRKAGITLERHWWYGSSTDGAADSTNAGAAWCKRGIKSSWSDDLVGACNNIRNAAEEIVLNELIYCLTPRERACTHHGTSSLFSLESELDRSCFDIPPACRKVRKCRNPNNLWNYYEHDCSYWHSSLLRVNYN